MGKTLSGEQTKTSIKVKGGHPEESTNLPTPVLAGRLTTSEIIEGLYLESKEVENSRTEWEQRQVRWYRQRMGVREKRTFPWPGASNIQIPTIDKSIKKLIPPYMNLIWGPRTICRFEVNANTQMTENVFEEAEYNEDLMDDIIKNRMEDSFKKTHRILDKMLERGHSIIKVTYDYKVRQKEILVNLHDDLSKEQKLMLTNNLEDFIKNDAALIELFLTLLEEKGVRLNLSIEEDRQEMDRNVKKFKDGENEEFSFNLDILEAHAPFWQVVNPEDLLVSGDVNDIQSAQTVTHTMKYSENQLRSLARQGVIDKEVTENIIGENQMRTEQNTTANKGQNSVKTSLQATQEQYQGSYTYSYGKGTKPIELREVFFEALDKKGIIRKYVLLFSPLYTDKPLKFHELPYDDGKWPFVKFSLEESSDGWLASRGVPQILDYLATTIDTMHNQKIDRMTIVNAPMMKYVTGMVNPANVRYIPGQFIPTKDINAVQPMVFPTNAQTSYIEEERELKSQVEDYLPMIDFSLTDPQAGTSKSRTLGEVVAAKQDKVDRFSLDAKLFLDSFNKLLEMTWSRWMQYGPKELEILAQGQENRVTWKKQYGVNQMYIRPRGTLFNSNPALKMQAAQEDLALVDHPIYGKFVQPYVILREHMRNRNPNTFKKKLKDLGAVIEENERADKALQQAQMEQAQAQEQALQSERDFELEKMDREHAHKMEQIEKEGKFKAGMEAVKLKASADKPESSKEDAKK